MLVSAERVPLPDGQPSHLRRPAHDGDDDLGMRSLEVEPVGDRHDLNAMLAQLLQRREGVGDPGPGQTVQAGQVQAWRDLQGVCLPRFPTP